MDNITLSINHDPEELTLDEAISAFAETKEGFIFPILDVAFKPEEFKKVLREIINLYPDIVEYDYSRNKNNIFKKYKGENIHLYVRANSMELNASFYLKSEECSQQIWKLYIENTKEESSVEIFSYAYSISGGQLVETIKVFKNNELDYISDKYYPYININVMFDQFFTGSENILLLVGDPGLGKSKLSTMALKYAINNPDKIPYDKMEDNPSLDSQFISVAFVKSIEVLANDSFWRTLDKNEPDFCIIDDLDYMLTKRDSEVQSHDDAIKNAFLNQFLSYTDGVEKNKTKFIITTNQRYDDIDAALLRKGRLFDILELRQLDKNEALEIWKENELNEKEFHRLFTTHEVLPAELGSEINKRLNKRIKTATESYLNEDGISKVQKAGRRKKIGL